MLDGIPTGVADFSGTAGLIVIAILVITRRLVWHADLTRERERGDRWEATALRALGVAEKMTVHAEVASEVLTGTVSEVPGVDST